MPTFFQSYLDLGLFPVDDNDTRLENLQSAVADLVKEFEEDDSLLPNYTLVALDGAITTDPVIDHVEGLIKQYWKQLRVKFTDQPIMVIRGVILTALDEVGKADVAAARIIYLSAVDSMVFFQQGKESELIQNLVLDLGHLAEDDATDEWVLKETLPELKLTQLRASKIALKEINFEDDGTLEKALKIAATNSPQGHGPWNQGYVESWSIHFAKEAAPAISTSISKALASITSNLSTDALQTSISSFFTEFKKSLETVLTQSFVSTRAVERRSKLLWWKEAMYSASLTNSYHEIDPLLQPLIAAIDLNNLVPEICPVSVDFLLRDALRLMGGGQQEVFLAKALIEKIAKSQHHDLLKEYLVPKENASHRVSLLEFATLVLHGNVKPADLKDRTGINEEQTLSMGNFAVFAFHHFLLGRLTSIDE